MRLLLAKLLLSGANVLLLDEPTNDLDLMTLRILEEALIAFDGASLVISHDRALLDRACTGILSFDGDGQVVRYASRAQALQARQRRLADAEPPPPRPVKAPPSRTPTTGLNWNERKEKDALPQRIQELETEQAEIAETLANPAVYKGGGNDAAALGARLREVDAEIEAAYERWEWLESRS
jgi:ATP-binding cassette subfamily F protein uup